MYFSLRPGFPGLSSLPIRYLAEAQARCGVCLSTGQDPPSPCLSGDHVVFIYLALGLTVWVNGIPYVRVPAWWEFQAGLAATPYCVHTLCLQLLAANLVRRVLP